MIPIFAQGFFLRRGRQGAQAQAVTVLNITHQPQTGVVIRHQFIIPFNGGNMIAAVAHQGEVMIRHPAQKTKEGNNDVGHFDI